MLGARAVPSSGITNLTEDDMKGLNEVYSGIQAKKKERKEIVKMFKDELAHDPVYQQIGEELKALRDRKKSIENESKAKALKDAERMDTLKLEIDSDTEMLADIALTKYAANEQTEIVDTDGVRWVPQFRVSYKKDKDSAIEQALQERAASHPERTFAPMTDADRADAADEAAVVTEEEDLQPA
jgi:hypothetical protein